LTTTVATKEQNTKRVTDDALLAASGDTAAFARLVQGSEGMLYRVCRAVLRSDADCADAVQDTVLTAWRNIGQLRDASRFPAWIARICVNRCYRIARSRCKPELIGERVAAGRDTCLLLDVMQAVRSLPDNLRLVVVFHYFEDWSVEETARALGIFPGTVKSRLHKARARLADALKGYEEGIRYDA
jgi:RNA polymerase sigma-70 factor (ECF subfamily)